LKFAYRRLGERSQSKTRRQHGIPMDRIARYHTVLVYKRIYLQQFAENYHINITKFEIPQVIAVENPVKFNWMIIIDH
jgi:hypothetical protein